MKALVFVLVAVAAACSSSRTDQPLQPDVDASLAVTPGSPIKFKIENTTYASCVDINSIQVLKPGCLPDPNGKKKLPADCATSVSGLMSPVQSRCAVMAFTVKSNCPVMVGSPPGKSFHCALLGGAPAPTPSPPACQEGTTKRTDSKAPRGYRCDCPAGTIWADEGSSSWSNGLRCDWGTAFVGPCRCIDKPTSTITPPFPTRVPTPTPTPMPTASPRPTATSTPKPGPSPSLSPKPSPTPTGSGCPPGTMPKLICEPVVTATPAPTPMPTKSPSPTTTSSVPVQSGFIKGGWFDARCARREAPTATAPYYRTYHYKDAIFAVGPTLALESMQSLGEPCAAETWITPLSGQEKRNDEVDMRLRDYADELAAMKAWSDSKKSLPPCTKENLKDCYPGPLRAFIIENGSFAWGVAQDLHHGGFYTMQNGVKVLRNGKKLQPALPAVTPYIISSLKSMGVEEFSIAPYVFGFANRWFLESWWGAAVHSADGAPFFDGRRNLPVNDPETRTLRGNLGAPEDAREEALDRIRRLNAINPKIWPLDYDWSQNKSLGIRPETALDLPNDIVARRDAFYYTQFVRAVKAQYPEINRIVPQLSNCVYGLQPTDAWMHKMGAHLPNVNVLYGYTGDVQLEGCNSTTNTQMGKAWNTPYADCASLKAILKAKAPVISMWSGAALPVIDADFLKCN